MLHRFSILLRVLLVTKNWWIYILDLLHLVKSPYVLEFEGLKIKVRPNGIDRWVVTENVIIDQYHLRDINQRKIETIVDIGGNIGSFTINISRKYRRARVLTFEPDPVNFDFLKENIILNHLEKRVKIINAAITDSNAKKVRLYTSRDAATGSSKVKSKLYIEVNNISISLVGKQIKGNAMLKMDIEGGEYDFFTKENLALLKKFKVIVLEYHDINKKLNHNTLIRFISEHKMRYAIFGLVMHIYP